VYRESRHEEYHVTVLGEPMAWFEFCRGAGIKPLFIELSDRRVQLLCAADFDPRVLIDDDGRFKVIRYKHEVSALLEGERALYYEAHAKFDGPVRFDFKGTSRDLFRVTGAVDGRWYQTRRRVDGPVDERFLEDAPVMAKHSTFVGSEVEIVLEDTNPSLDFDWPGVYSSR
jgi:hypothetical protein